MSPQREKSRRSLCLTFTNSVQACPCRCQADDSHRRITHSPLKQSPERSVLIYCAPWPKCQKEAPTSSSCGLSCLQLSLCSGCGRERGFPRDETLISGWRKHQVFAGSLPPAYSFRFQVTGFCGDLTLAGCQVPTKAALSLPFWAGQGRENVIKGSWVEMRTARDPSAIPVTDKTDSAWEN